MENKKIGEFIKGDKIEGFYLVKSSDCKITNNSTTNKYLDLILMDSTGEINAKLWECINGIETVIKENILVKVRAVVTEYRGKLQLKIDKIRCVVEEDNIDVDEFIMAAPYKSEDMFELILDYIDKIENQYIKGITQSIVGKVSDKLMHYPAAKSNHHAIKGGLLYHVTTMLRAAEKLMEIYTYLNKDLVYAGVILHDIAKIKEMESSELGIVSKYSVEGQLLGHIIQGINLIDEAGKSIGADKEVIMLLQHMILTHHYEPEYGSPKKPMIPEAELLHHLDVIDARMYDMQKAIRDVKEGEFSEKIYSLDGINIYKSIL
ncbi:MAG: HD domain-containing protein [Clostridium sp.]|uniref:3'-5' exoribonuclease YhaM family protein n=1 Tax=Clostridium culturomicium TaxID=1499683 RepID=UPI002911F009|nr:HD domain-containing protein [Clostridium sp.]MDU7085810.1 HD domain-containing protein [Clostridium sp.]